MIKKILAVILSLCLGFSVSALAENSNDTANTNVPPVSEEMPMQGGMSGGRGGMPPGEKAQNGEMPPRPRGGMQPMADGEMPPMPEGEMPPRTENEMPTMPDGEVPSMPEGEISSRPQGGMQTGEQGTEMPSGGMENFGRGMPGDTQTAETQQKSDVFSFVQTYSTPITSVIVLIFAFIFVIFYKRKQY